MRLKRLYGFYNFLRRSMVLGLILVVAGSLYLPNFFTLPAHADSYPSVVNIYVEGGYSGVLTLTSGQHEFGNCNSGPGQSFNVSSSSPTTCQGYQFGPPNGVTLFLNQPLPSGYNFNGWSVISSSTNGTLSCSTNQCFFNFTSGSVDVAINLSPQNVSSSPVSAPPPQTTVQSPVYRAPKRSAPVSVANLPVAPLPAKSSTTSPNTPTNFQAGLSSTMGNEVILSWSADTSTSSIAITYSLARSSDNGSSWKTITPSITATTYTDKNLSGNKTYLYRLTALDQSGNKSPLVITKITTTSFKANAGPSQKTVLVSPNKIIRVLIPIHSLAKPAYCYLYTTNSSGISSSAGSYQVVCKYSDRTLAVVFQKSLTVQVSNGQSQQMEFQTSDNGIKWNPLQPINYKTKGDTSFTLKPNQAWFRLLSSTKKATPWWRMPVLIGLIVIAIVYISVPRIINRIRQQQIQKINDDYWRKMNGY